MAMREIIAAEEKQENKVITGDVERRGRASTEDDSSRRLPGLSMSAMFG